MDITKKNLSRRTVATGVAWTVPAVAVASAVPAFASSPIDNPGNPEFTGTWCKHPGEPKWYHNSMAWTNTAEGCTMTITLKNMDVNGVEKPAYANIDGKLVQTFTLAAGERTEFYIDAGTYGDSANGYATLYYDWSMTCGDETTTGSASIGTDIGNNLPPCKDPVKENPPHDNM